MFRKSLSLIMVFFSLTGYIFSETYLEKTQNSCSSGLYAVSYVKPTNETKYSWGFYAFSDEKVDIRNLLPKTSAITLVNGSILLDSCNICMPFFQYDSIRNFHKYIFEIRKPNEGNETIALEYGPTFVKDSTIADFQSKAGYSYFITLAVPDTIASQYSLQELVQTHIFTDASNNSLYEYSYNGRVVGIRYFCANNYMEYTRFFIPKS